MQDLSIDIVSLFKYCFEQYKKYANFIIGAVITYFVLAVLPQVFFTLNAPQNPTTKTEITSLILTMVQVFLSLGFTKIILFLAEDKYVEVSDMFNNFNIFLSYFVSSFLYGIAIFLGTILLILPGIWVAIRFQFYPYFIIEEGSSSFDALRLSYEYTTGFTLELFILGVVVVVLNAIGVLFFGIGIILTYPLTTMAVAVVYKGLIEESPEIPSQRFQPQE